MKAILPAILLWGATLTLVRISTASSVSGDLRYGQARLDGNAPGARFYGAKLSGLLDVHENLSLRLGGMFTRYEPTPTASGLTVFQTLGGLHWDPNENWAFGIGASFSPTATGTFWQSTTATSSTGATVPATAEIENQTGSFGFDLSGEYDTAGESNAETVLGLSFGAVDYMVRETTRAVRSATGEELSAQGSGSTSCRGANCGSSGKGDSSVTQSSIWQFRASVAITETLYESTDLDLSASYYAYTVDTARMGRSASGAISRSLVTDGMPTQPLQFSVRPAVVHRFGALAVEPSFEYGRYTDDRGYSMVGGLRIHYRFTKEWKVWAGGSVQSSVIESSGSMVSGWGNLGVRFRF